MMQRKSGQLRVADVSVQAARAARMIVQNS
jgi:hypothetical protein